MKKLTKKRILIGLCSFVALLVMAATSVFIVLYNIGYISFLSEGSAIYEKRNYERKILKYDKELTVYIGYKGVIDEELFIISIEDVKYDGKILEIKARCMNKKIEFDSGGLFVIEDGEIRLSILAKINGETVDTHFYSIIGGNGSNFDIIIYNPVNFSSTDNIELTFKNILIAVYNRK